MLTETRKKLLEVYRTAEKRRMPTPTYRVLAEAVGLHPSTITYHIVTLVEERWLEPVDGEGFQHYRLTKKALKKLGDS